MLPLSFGRPIFHFLRKGKAPELCAMHCASYPSHLFREEIKETSLKQQPPHDQPRQINAERKRPCNCFIAGARQIGLCRFVRRGLLGARFRLILCGARRDNESELAGLVDFCELCIWYAGKLFWKEQENDAAICSNDSVRSCGRCSACLCGCSTRPSRMVGSEPGHTYLATRYHPLQFNQTRGRSFHRLPRDSFAGNSYSLLYSGRWTVRILVSAR